MTQLRVFLLAALFAPACFGQTDERAIELRAFASRVALLASSQAVAQVSASVVSQATAQVAAAIVRTNDTRPLALSGPVGIAGELTVGGHIVEKNCRAFAYLVAASNTVVTNVPPYYAPVAGVFSNTVLEGFGGTTVDGNPAIVYTNGINDFYEVTINSQCSAPDNGTTIYVGAKMNGTAGNGDVMSAYAKTGGESVNLSVNAVYFLTNGATIQLVCGSDKGTAGKVVSFQRFNTSIKRFR